MTGAEILKIEAARRCIPLDMLLSRSREPELVAARIAIAQRIAAERRLSLSQIGRLMKRSISTVSFYINDDAREAKRAYSREREARLRAG